ncbi:MAG: tetratricopeptide repeat protein [Desulfobacula sp.]|nr:tetratricopeptide repeat protein [Desulfobacula sp.]
MSEQKVSNERKKELEQIDPFQAGLLKVITYVKEYKKQLLLMAGAFVLVAVVFTSVMYSFQKSEKTAATLVTQILTKYDKLDDPQNGYIEIENDFLTIFADYPNTAAGKQALIQFAKISYDALKFDQSYKYYQKALEVFKDEALMKNFLLSSLGNTCIARKDFDGAREYYMQIKQGQSELLKDEAQFALAMLYEAENNKTESKKMYEAIVAEYANSMYISIAQSKIN